MGRTPRAHVVCWSLDESQVCCLFDGRKVWLRPFRVAVAWTEAETVEWWHVRHNGIEYTTGTDAD